MLESPHFGSIDHHLAFVKYLRWQVTQLSFFVRYPPKLGEEDWFVYLMLQKSHIDIDTMTFNDNISSVSIYQLSARASLGESKV